LGLVRGENPYTPRNAKSGDILVLTKPLGAQMVVNVNQYMRNNDEKWNILESHGLVDRESFTQTYLSSVEYMGRLNRIASITMQKYGVTSSTDVTGFGILGHA
jgi:selenide,water dikinase